MPELDVARIRRWSRHWVYQSDFDEVRLDVEVTARHVTIVRLQSWVMGNGDVESVRLPMARLRYESSSGLWSLHWARGPERFVRHETLAPTRLIGELLDELDRGETSPALP